MFPQPNTIFSIFKILLEKKECLYFHVFMKSIYAPNTITSYVLRNVFKLCLPARSVSYFQYEHCDRVQQEKKTYIQSVNCITIIIMLLFHNHITTCNTYTYNNIQLYTYTYYNYNSLFLLAINALSFNKFLFRSCGVDYKLGDINLN